MNDLQTLNERIAERVGENLVDLIPQDQWQQIVNKEIETFKNVTAPKVISEMILKAFEESIKSHIGSFTHTNDWSSMTQEGTNAELKKFLGECGGEMFAAILNPAMHQVMHNLRNQLGY